MSVVRRRFEDAGLVFFVRIVYEYVRVRAPMGIKYLPEKKLV